MEREALARLVEPLGEVDRVEPLHGDGSSRRFFRVWSGARSFVLLEGPDREENAAYVRVGRHLARAGVRVPTIHAVDAARGWVLLEDVGDRSLYRALGGCRTESEVLALYRPVLALLARMQVVGAEGFDLSVGFAPSPYGAETMVEWEGLYFSREFSGGLLGLEEPAGFRGDVERLAAEGAGAPAGWFLHRDFQSRNIHLADNVPVVIDFQGARPGPLAYDAAALLLDPYAALAARARERLLGEYLDLLGAIGVDPAEVRASWFALGACRLLQALGAFGKLGGRLGKGGFLEHAAAALDQLVSHLADRGPAEYPALWALVCRARERWASDGPAIRRACAGDRPIDTPR